MIQRIGFCCKYVIPGKKDFEPVPDFNIRATTVAWLKRQSKADAEKRLWEIVEHNLTTTFNLVKRVGELDESLRMVRLGSDILPVYTEPNFGYFYRDPSVQSFCERGFAKIGDLARRSDVRLSFHPGQFTVLASDNPDIVERSIEEFEYHADMARWMGYGGSWHDHGFKINVHISGRQGPDGIRSALSKLSPEARNLITIENEENAHGLDATLQLHDCCALVLDLHHHWIKTGEYIQADDDRVRRVIDSWRGTRPTLHYSLSREDILPKYVANEQHLFLDMERLLSEGHKKQKLRAHSDYYWNTAANQWALSFWREFDICCESKAKNLASFALYEFANKQTSLDGRPSYLASQ